jgi:hypothetical protein
MTLCEFVIKGYVLDRRRLENDAFLGDEIQKNRMNKRLRLFCP